MNISATILPKMLEYQAFSALYYKLSVRKQFANDATTCMKGVLHLTTVMATVQLYKPNLLGLLKFMERHDCPTTQTCNSLIVLASMSMLEVVTESGNIRIVSTTDLDFFNLLSEWMRL